MSVKDNRIDAVWKGVEGEVKKLRTANVQERKQLDQQRHNLEAARATLATQHGIPPASCDSLVKLNVGGRERMSPRSTLQLVSNSLLSAMFSGRWDKSLPRDRKGRIFLDMDGDSAGNIFDYLMELKRLPAEESAHLTLASAPDDRYVYHLASLLGILAEDSADSTTLTPAQQSELRAWLPHQHLELLYRMTRDGSTASDFHSRCDDKGATVVVIKCGQAVFGGYTSQPWQGVAGYYRTDDQAFLFRLSPTSSGDPAQKLPHVNNGHAIYNNSGYGPTFGGGHDLCITGTTCNTNPGNSYRNVTGRADTLCLSGSTIDEYEVFQVVNSSSQSNLQQTGTAAAPTVQITLSTPNSLLYQALVDSIQDLLTTVDADTCATKEAPKLLEEETQAFEQECADMKVFIGEEDDDVVELNVYGTVMATRRSTLRMCPESQLAAQFDKARWDTGDNDVCKDEEGRYFIEENPYVFGQILNILRMKRYFKEGLPLPRLDIHADKQAVFKRSVEYHFPGVESYILDQVAWR